MDIKYGVIAPFIYSLVLLWVMLSAINEHHKEPQDKNNLLDEIAMYCAVSPWAAMTVFSWFQVNQLTEVLCTNTGFILISGIFIYKSVNEARREYQDLVERKITGQYHSPYFEENCRRYGLTQREIEIAFFIRRGLKNKAIADQLNITESTVKKHIENVFNKTRATSRVELVHQLFFTDN